MASLPSFVKPMALVFEIVTGPCLCAHKNTCEADWNVSLFINELPDCLCMSRLFCVICVLFALWSLSTVSFMFCIGI